MNGNTEESVDNTVVPGGRTGVTNINGDNVVAGDDIYLIHW
jgi:hypothetical protein